jgi:hypothetical protein
MNLLKVFGALSANQPGAAAAPGSFDLVEAVGPLVSAAVTGYTIYKIARSMKIDKAKCRGLAITVGVTTAIGQIANSWYSGYLSKAGIV